VSGRRVEEGMNQTESKPGNGSRFPYLLDVYRDSRTQRAVTKNADEPISNREPCFEGELNLPQNGTITSYASDRPSS
jgi:hypothetical protein